MLIDPYRLPKFLDGSAYIIFLEAVLPDLMGDVPDAETCGFSMMERLLILAALCENPR